MSIVSFKMGILSMSIKSLRIKNIQCLNVYSLSQIQMSDEYHTPKDLVNKQPLTIGLEVFEKNGGTVESYGSESFQRLNHTPSGDPNKVIFQV